MRAVEAVAEPVATGVATTNMMKALAILMIDVDDNRLQIAKHDMMKAYDTFGNAATEHALKVILTSPERQGSA